MNKKFIFLFLPLLLLYNCADEKPQHEHEGILYADLPKDTLPIDTIPTGVQFDFKVDTVLSFMSTEYDVVPGIRPLTRQNVFAKGEVKTVNRPEMDTIFNVIPDTVRAEPYIGWLSHPQPLKAGDMTTSKYSSENIQTLGIDQGLNAPQVYNIIEDKFGFLWFGTNSGLTRYDGKYLYHYTTDNGLISNRIFDLFNAPDGRMWICTDEGLMIYDGDHLEIYNETNGLTTNSPFGMRKDKDNNVWFLCDNGGVIKYDGKTFFRYTQERGLQKNDNFCIGFDHSGDLFISSAHQRPEVLHFKENYSVRYKEKVQVNFFGSTMTLNTFNDVNGDLWTVSYNGGVHHIINDSTSLHFNPKTGINFFSMSCGLQDSRGNFWYSMQDAGISYDNGSEFIGYTEEVGLSSNIVFTMIEDSKGNIWAGTSQGVTKIVPESFKNMTTKDGLSDKSVTGLSVSPNGNLLISTWTDGFFLFDGKRFERYQPGSIVLDMERDHFGNLATGIHQGGVQFMIPSAIDTVEFDKKYHISREAGYHVWNTRSILKDDVGNLWTADDVHGIYCFKLNEDKSDYGSIERYTQKSGLLHNGLRDIYIDKEGTMYIAYMNAIGISVIKDGKIEHLNSRCGFPSDYITQFYEDREGNFWMTSKDGLILKQGDDYKVFTTQDGLSYDLTTSIIQDKSGRLWVGSSNGLNMMIKNAEGENDYSITNFNARDGLSATSFISKGVAIDSSNTIWWATTQSLISLNLDRFEHQYGSPEVTITDISILTDHINFVDLDDTGNIALDKAELGQATDYFNVPQSMSLPFDMSSISIKYGSLKGNPTHHLKYRYWLKGFHDDWVKPTNEAEASFTNLPAGNYEFQVQARLANNEWGPITSYQFEIRPPFWQRWWFRILVAGILIYAIYLIFRLRNRQLRKRKEELEYTVMQRTFEIEQQKHIIEEKQVEILDSINYAQRIQKSLMATDQMLNEHLKDYFVYFQPKDIVSGDFYWATPASDGTFLVVNADSTGHGVPGAIMSMLNISCLEKATESEGLHEPAAVLDFTRKKVIETLAKDGSAEGGKDGMDCSLVKFDLKNLKLSYAAAHNGIWIIRNDELIEFKADKMPVGKHSFDQTPFTQTEVQLQKGDIVYTFTDGYPDQFGGDKGKKFKYKSLKKLLQDLSGLPMKDQERKLREHFNQWKGDLEQLDDVCIIGVRV
ncbi:MAG: two-component regulator propeller domain-containing protein [Crocinitomicaceae bacterium]|nr:SpoIIE family protein phosphatase [Crocinitomicaceae bacterium]